MTVLVPAALLALLALAVPLWVHWVQRRSTKATAFPSLMFLEDLQVRHPRRRPLERWPLLLLRCLALGLLVLAFAHPVLQGEGALLGGTTQRDVIVAVDRSYSMGYGDHWSRALAAAADVVASLGTGDRGALVWFDGRGEIAVDLTADHAVLEAALARGPPGPGATDFRAPLDSTFQLLRPDDQPEAPPGPRETRLVVISDFWGPNLPSDVPLPPGVALETVAIRSADPVNLAVVAIDPPAETADTPTDTPTEPAPGSLAVRVANTGTRPLAPGVATVALAVDGQRRHQLPLEAALAPGEMATVAFPAPPSRGDVAVVATVAAPADADALAADNRFYRVLGSPPALNVALVSAGDGDDRYLKAALAVAEAPVFQVTTIAPGELTVDHLRRHRVVILNDVPPPGNQWRATLGNYIKGGGGVWAIAGAGARGLWPGGEAGYLPGDL
ncbi:MAG: BatA domain-containing protein, partial [Candidatus Competibacterales bacterium]